MTIRTALLIIMAMSGTAPAFAKDCRVPGAPPGISVQAPLGCELGRQVSPKPKTSQELRASREPGFLDLGNGSSLRIGGRVRVDGMTRH